jgi:hypothetical protein
VRTGGWAIFAAVLLGATATIASAQEAPGPDEPDGSVLPDEDPAAVSTGAITKKIAVLRLEALGMEEEPVNRLESLFRMELERLAGEPLPTRRKIDKTIAKDRRLRKCSGEDKCLAKIGKKLGVDAVVSGSVAGLGDSFTINIKVVDVKTAKQLRRIASDPLKGSPDELIEAVRVAAYKLLAPDELLGAVAILTDLVGAKVTIDDKVVGTTPILEPIRRLDLGEHALKVEAEGYSDFEETVTVRFQKTTRVIVRLKVEGAPDNGTGDPLIGDPRIVTRPAEKHWYTNKWFYVGAGVAAVLVGGYIGYSLANDSVIDCSADPGACM